MTTQERKEAVEKIEAAVTGGILTRKEADKKLNELPPATSTDVAKRISDVKPVELAFDPAKAEAGRRARLIREDINGQVFYISGPKPVGSNRKEEIIKEHGVCDPYAWGSPRDDGHQDQGLHIVNQDGVTYMISRDQLYNAGPNADGLWSEENGLIQPNWGVNFKLFGKYDGKYFNIDKVQSA